MPSGNRLRLFEIWNRKFHIYIGLYLLLFVWMFSISGLILNHPRWKFTQFWSQRKQSTVERSIQTPQEPDNQAKAKNLMRQLDISGEIYTIREKPELGEFNFRVLKPKDRFDVKANFNTGQATVQQSTVNAWGWLNLFHRLSGVRMNNPNEKRDWVMTKVWSFSMDAVAVGLLVMVFGGIYMWYQIMPKRRLGWIVLGLGILCCGFFIFGLGRFP